MKMTFNLSPFYKNFEVMKKVYDNDIQLVPILQEPWSYEKVYDNDIQLVPVFTRILKLWRKCTTMTFNSSPFYKNLEVIKKVHDNDI